MNLLVGHLLRRRSKKNRNQLRQRRLRMEALEDRCLTIRRAYECSWQSPEWWA
jgi:hypothetical protein